MNRATLIFRNKRARLAGVDVVPFSLRQQGSPTTGCAAAALSTP